MIHRHRSDTNQTDIVNALRKIGYTVADTSQAGGGFPDIVVGYGGINVMIEIKSDTGSPSQTKLTPAQVKFHDEWGGQICIVKTAEEAIEQIKQYFRGE